MNQAASEGPASGADPRSLVVRFVNEPEDRVVPPGGAGIGRAPSNELAVPEKLGFMVSGKHARLLVRDGAWWIADQDSTNGTFVNGEQIIGMKRLRDGDRVSFGPEGLEGAVAMAVVSGAGARGARPAPRAPEPGGHQSTPIHGQASGTPAHTPGGSPAPASGSGGGWNPLKKISQNLERRKNRKELQREQRDLEAQLPTLDGAHATACAALGMQASKCAECEALASGESVADAARAVEDLRGAVARAEQRAGALTKAHNTLLTTLQNSVDAARKAEHAALDAFTGASEEAERAQAGVRSALGAHIDGLKSAASVCTELAKALEGRITQDVLGKLPAAGDQLERAAELARTRPPGLDKAVTALSGAQADQARASKELDACKGTTLAAEKSLSEAKTKANAEAGDAQRETQAAREQAVAAEQALTAKYQALGEEALASGAGWVASLSELAAARSAAAQAEQMRAQIRELQERAAALG